MRVKRTGMHARVLVAAALAAAGLPAHAQESRGAIIGRVLDPSSATVAGATVRAIHQDTNTRVSTVSNETGNFELPYLLPGMHRLEVEAAGFKKSVRGGIEVRVDDRVALEVSLELGDVTQVVDVSADVPLLETATSSLGAVVQSRQLRDLPVPSGNPLMAAQLAPGVVFYGRPAIDYLPGAYSHPNNISIGGSSVRTAEFSLDGAPNMQRSNVAFIPVIDIIEEVKVQTAGYDASIGHTSAGSVNAVIKAGGNRFHGTLFEYNTSGPMVGTDFFTNRFLYDPRTGPVTEEKKKAAHPKEILNRYGGTLTGPLRIPRIYNGHDRTFFSYGFQGFKRRSTNAAQYNMPAAQQRAGDFSALLAVGSQYQIYDPATVTPAAGGRFHRDPFPGNRVPASRFDPMAVRLMDYWVMPNAPGTADGRQNYASSNFFGVNYWSHVGRVDHVFSDSNRFFARVLKDELMRRDEWYPNIARGTNRTGLNEGLTLDDVHVFSPSFLMNAKFSVSRVDETAGRRTSGMDITTLGFPASLAGQIDRRGATFPEISVDGLFGLGEAGGNRFIVNYYTWSASFTKSRGNHSLRFGGEYRILQENGIEWGNVSPAIDFGTTWTRGPLDNAPESPSGIGQGFASFLLGLPTGGAIHYRPFYAEQSSFMGVYIQDDWKLTRRLTVNFGLRYEREGPTTERFDRSVRQFDFITPNPLEPAARAAYARSPIPEVPAAQFRTTGGLTFAGAGGNPRGLWATDDNNFAPRIGFAWAAAPATVVRGGYGIFFESMGINRISVNSTGFSITNQLVPSLDNGRTFRATLRNPFPDPLTPPPGASGGLLTNVGQGVSFFDSKPSSPYMQRWSVGMQRELPFRVLAEATYVGTRGTKFRIGRDHNPVPRQWLTTSPLRDNATVNFLSAQVANPFFGLMPSGAGLTGRNVARSQLLRAYPHFTGISAQYAAGSSWYHSLQFRLEKRLSKGFSLSGNYTWSKSMQAMSYLNPTDDRPEHVISSLDRPQRLVVNGIYELPFGPGKRFAHVRGPLRHFVEGWQASAIYTAQSGPPIAFGNIAFFGDLHDIPLPRSERSPNRWFNTQAGFNRNSREQPSNNVRTLSSRFTGLRADGRNFWALAAMKNFVLREGVKLQLRAEAQNALNHPHFAAPNVVPTNVLFGTVSATDGEPRLMFAGLKLLW